VADLDALETRIKALEAKKSVRELVLQNLFGPLLVALVTGLGALYIQYVANRTQTRLDTTTKQIERMKVAQQMVADLFSDNQQRALATEEILTRVLDDQDLKNAIHELVANYYAAKVVGAIAEGKPEQASTIVDAAKQVDSPTAKLIVEKAQREHGPELARGDKYRIAADAEERGFAALQAGNLAEAKKAFAVAVRAAPEYHNVSDVARLIDKAIEERDAAQRQAMAKGIVERYAFRMAPEAREELRAQQNVATQAPPRTPAPPLPTLEGP
jgi:hypothetical protein